MTPQNGMSPYPLDEQARPTDQVTTVPSLLSDVDDSYYTLEDIILLKKEDSAGMKSKMQQAINEASGEQNDPLNTSDDELERILNSDATAQTAARTTTEEQKDERAACHILPHRPSIAAVTNDAHFRTPKSISIVDRRNRVSKSVGDELALKPSRSPRGVEDFGALADLMMESDEDEDEVEDGEDKYDDSDHHNNDQHSSQQLLLQQRQQQLKVDDEIEFDDDSTFVNSSPRVEHVFDRNPPNLRVKKASSIKIYLDDLPQDKFNSLVKELKRNKHIRKIEVVLMRMDQTIQRSTEQLDLFFRTAYILPNLHSLIVRNLAESSLRYFPFIIYGQETIRTLKLHFASGTIDETTCRALVSMQHLEALELEVNASFDVGALMKSSSCRVLKIIGKRSVFDTTHVVSMMQPLETNTTLKTLDLGPSISGMPMKAIAHALQHNMTLEELHVSFDASKQDVGEAVMESFAQTLAINSTLKVLWNHSYSRIHLSPRKTQEVLEALRLNRRLLRFHMFDEDVDFWFKKTEVMERNKNHSSPTAWLLPFFCMSA